MATDSQNKYTEQNILNKSYDETYHVLAVEMLAENEAGTALEKVKISQLSNPLDKYAFYADETTATYYYYCGEDKDGNWYISRETLATHVTDYAVGTSDVATNWGDRATQTYGTFGSKF